jgi:hypothetical protein
MATHAAPRGFVDVRWDNFDGAPEISARASGCRIVSERQAGGEPHPFIVVCPVNKDLHKESP